MPQMNSLKPMSQSENLLRHPSAEDLDAAHQLVSSARGARERAVEIQREREGGSKEDIEMGDGSDGDGNEELTSAASVTERQGQMETLETSNSQVGPQHRAPRSPGRDAAFLGHSCRFVVLFIP